MINDVVLEGIVVRTWKFADDLLFRLACYRDPDLPQKPLHPLSGAQRASETQDAADFVTNRVPKGNLGAPGVMNRICKYVCTVFRIRFQPWRGAVSKRMWNVVKQASKPDS